MQGISPSPSPRVVLVNAQATLKRGCTAPTPTVSIATLQMVNTAFGNGLADNDIDLRITANGAVTIGDGTANGMIGLWGKDPVTGFFSLLGILGITLAAGSFPQVPIMDGTHGYSQIVRYAGVYSQLGVGGVLADVATGGPLVTVTAVALRSTDLP